MRFKIDWASLIVGSKLTAFTLFYFVFEGNFQVKAPGGLYLEGLIHGGAYFRNFTVLKGDKPHFRLTYVRRPETSLLKLPLRKPGLKSGIVTLFCIA